MCGERLNDLSLSQHDDSRFRCALLGAPEA